MDVLKDQRNPCHITEKPQSALWLEPLSELLLQKMNHHLRTNLNWKFNSAAVYKRYKNVCKSGISACLLRKGNLRLVRGTKERASICQPCFALDRNRLSISLHALTHTHTLTQPKLLFQLTKTHNYFKPPCSMLPHCYWTKRGHLHKY